MTGFAMVGSSGILSCVVAGSAPTMSMDIARTTEPTSTSRCENRRTATRYSVAYTAPNTIICPKSFRTKNGMNGTAAMNKSGRTSLALGIPQYVRARFRYRTARIAAKPIRKGTLAGSQGVIFPIDFPARDVIAAIIKGTSVSKTIKMPLFCRKRRVSSRRIATNATIIRNIAASGMIVLPDVNMPLSESLGGRKVSAERSTGAGGVAGRPIICFFSGE